jgi:hypothetical protein
MLYNRLGLLAAGALAIAVFGQSATAQEPKTNFMIGAELRWFPDEPKWSGQDDKHFYPSIFGQAEFSYTWDTRNEINLIGFGRLDIYDWRRTHFDAREAYYRYNATSWELLVGAHRVFWGTAESRHLVNIINQVDQVEDIDGDEYLGQPMVNLAFKGDWGRVDLFAMTFFRERTFNSSDARLRGPLPIKDIYDPKYESDWGEWNVDLAARYQNSFGPVDLGVSIFHGTSREPILRPAFNFSDGLHLRPYYETMTQAGLDVAWAIGSLVLKGEAIYRFNQGSPFFATVFGGEYTINNAFGGVDLGLLAEFNWDDRKQSKNAPTIYDEDIFGGVRLTFNDTADSRVLFGALYDVKDGSTYFYVEASRRLFDNWRIELEARYFTGKEDDVLQAIDADSYAQLRIMRYF